MDEKGQSRTIAFIHWSVLTYHGISWLWFEAAVGPEVGLLHGCNVNAVQGHDVHYDIKLSPYFIDVNYEYHEGRIWQL